MVRVGGQFVMVFGIYGLILSQPKPLVQEESLSLPPLKLGGWATGHGRMDYRQLSAWQTTLLFSNKVGHPKNLPTPRIWKLLFCAFCVKYAVNRLCHRRGKRTFFKFPLWKVQLGIFWPSQWLHLQRERRVLFKGEARERVKRTLFFSFSCYFLSKPACLGRRGRGEAKKGSSHHWLSGEELKLSFPLVFLNKKCGQKAKLPLSLTLLLLLSAVHFSRQANEERNRWMNNAARMPGICKWTNLSFHSLLKFLEIVFMSFSRNL